MKGFENFWDLASMGVGMFGALLKGIKKRFRTSTIILSMLVAGILTYSVTGVVAYFYADVDPKVIVLISFCVGWVANELTDKMDEFIGDIYEILIEYLKNKFSNGKK
jgi:hypothetical protein